MKERNELLVRIVKGNSYDPSNQYPNGKLTRYWCFDEDELDHLIQLIAKDCVRTIQGQMLRNGSNTPENLRSSMHAGTIASTYDIELPIEDYEGLHNLCINKEGKWVKKRYYFEEV